MTGQPTTILPLFDPDRGFAGVYDLLYGTASDFLTAREHYLAGWLAPVAGTVLDAGCGTGHQLLSLYRRGRRAVGLDLDPAMLALARQRLAAHGLPPRLLRADLRRPLPLAPAFGAILCLESPLAYLQSGRELDTALAEFYRLLRPGGVLVLDVFDYLATFGPEGTAPQTTHFPFPRGEVIVQEAHRYEPDAHVWHMRQSFSIRGPDGQASFSIHHRLYVRSPQEYVAALERAGFGIAELRHRYPSAGSHDTEEQRVICVAQVRAA